MTLAAVFEGPLEMGKSLEEMGKAVLDSPRPLEHLFSGMILRVQPSPIVHHMLLGALRHPRLRLKKPLSLTLTTENEYILAEYPAWGVMGYGTHLSAALGDLQQTIAELFFTLKEDQNKLGGDLPGVWASMQQMITERAA